MIRHLYLIGYRGSGKSSVGRVIAELLERPIIDSDDWIEQEANLSIREIFELEGESGFRSRETQAIQKISNLDSPHIVSLGGGAILAPANRDAIRRSGWVVWLQASAMHLYERINGDTTTAERRPALTKLSGLEEIQSILATRTPIYQLVSDYSIDTDSITTRQIAEEIVSHLRTQRDQYLEAPKDEKGAP